MEYKTIVDSKEKTPLRFENSIRKSLETGDYSIEGEENQIAIERKSIPDLIKTLTYGHARFKRELQRAFDFEYFAIIVEGSYTALIDKMFVGAEYTQVKTQTISRILFTIHMKYKVPIFFSNGKFETKKIVKELLDAYMRNKG